MNTLEEVLRKINKDSKSNIVGFGVKRAELRKIPFTSLRLNYMLYGGLPRGRIIEFFGAEGSGKTTSALDIVKNSQKLFELEYNSEIEKLEKMENRDSESNKRLEFLRLGSPKKVVYIDCENTLDEDWARTLGVDIDNLVVLKPEEQTAEQIFEITMEILLTGEIGLIVLDSIGVMISSQAYEKTIEEKTYGGISKALTVFSQKLILACNRYDTTFIGINQIREDLSATYQNAYTTPGGKAWKHNCSVRMEFRKGYYINEKNERLTNADSISPDGNVVDVAIKKTKVCKPNRLKGMFTINYTFGIDYISDLIDLAIKFDICTQRGSYFNFYDNENNVRTFEDRTLSFQGKYNLYNYIKQNSEFNTLLYKEVSDKLI